MTIKSYVVPTSHYPKHFSPHNNPTKYVSYYYSHFTAEKSEAQQPRERD